MQRVGFVGEVPDTPLSTPDAGARALRFVANLLAVCTFLIVAVGSLMLGGWVTPFHYYDTMVVVAVALAPALLVLASFAAKDGSMLLAVPFGQSMKALNKLAGLAVFLIIVPGNFILWANQHFDASPAVDMVLPVQEAWIRTGRHGSRSYMASVVADVRSPLGRWSFYRNQPVRLTHVAWDRVTPGRSRLLLRRHNGRLGFRWYEPDPEILP